MSRLSATASARCCCRAAVCAVILTPPTMLMGATLPVIARLRGVDVGRIYTANLAGGALGTVIAGFYLLRVHDVFVASGVAIAINVVVASPRAGIARSSRHLTLWHLRHLGTHPQAPCAPSTAPCTRSYRCRGSSVRIYGARRGGGVDPPVVPAVWRQRLYVLADPRDVSWRSRHWRLDRRARGAAIAGARGRARPRAAGAGARHRRRRVVDRQRVAAVAADAISFCRRFMLRRR